MEIRQVDLSSRRSSRQLERMLIEAVRMDDPQLRHCEVWTYKFEVRPASAASIERAASALVSDIAHEEGGKIDWEDEWVDAEPLTRLPAPPPCWTWLSGEEVFEQVVAWQPIGALNVLSGDGRMFRGMTRKGLQRAVRKACSAELGDGPIRGWVHGVECRCPADSYGPVGLMLCSDTSPHILEIQGNSYVKDSAATED